MGLISAANQPTNYGGFTNSGPQHQSNGGRGPAAATSNFTDLNNSRAWDVRGGGQGQSAGNSGRYAAGGPSTPGNSLVPAKSNTEVCRVQNAPYLIEQLRQRQETHITPHIDRERDETIVQQVIQPIKDHVVAEPVHHHAQAALVSRELSEPLNPADANRYRAQRELATTGGKSVERIDQGTFQNNPVVKEKINVHVIEEVQPVIWRTIDETHVYHTSQPIYEHHTTAPRVQEIRYNPPISLEEFEKRGGSMTGTGLYRADGSAPTAGRPSLGLH
ncbi:uncharacterized protein EV422DRAFT_19216 [Fimicolochytrium jonesii]|uniref:uncharacterized protein n=1 Tax=Fimicolochytrium jonesii TaxID=1396493 RepID=UPI0022FDD854|nr:uncharacterized protein EV422DRAFT_19216 [Fimicolochytrium jonesii]KAI8826951.1 hypothetical protein EV422DRAFT_19216 [Fimicolochytrium jonesii]